MHVSLTDCYRESEYGEPIVALKSYMMSPFIEPRHVEQLVRDVFEARQAVADMWQAEAAGDSAAGPLGGA